MAAVSENHLVYASRPQKIDGKDEWVFPPTDTLAMTFVMDCIWVTPVFINVERLKSALAETLSLFPPVSGRLCKYPDTPHAKGSVYIKLTNSGIPLQVVDDHSLEKLPFETTIIPVEVAAPWMNPIQFMNVVDQDEPLLKVKVTRLSKTGEAVLTWSWLHALGDGATVYHFLQYVNHFYRNGNTPHSLVPPNFTKVFLPPPPADPSAADKYLPLMKHLRDAKPMQELYAEFMQSVQKTTPLNFIFSLSQLQQLQKIALAHSASSTRISRADVLIAYLVYTYNSIVTEFSGSSGAETIDTVVSTLNYRGNPRLAPTAMFGNAAITLTCPSFTAPSLPQNPGPRERQEYFGSYLSAIAQTIRQGSEQARDPKFMEPYLSFHYMLCQRCYDQGLLQRLFPATPREITFNSSHAIDFRQIGGLYEPDSEFADGKYTQLRTSSIMEKYIRVFGASPMKVPKADGTGYDWDFTNVGGLEAAFALDKSIAELYKARIAEDMRRDFQFSVAAL